MTSRRRRLRPEGGYTNRIGEEPSRAVQSQIKRGRALALIFGDDEETYVERRLVTRHRITGEFARAVHPVTQKGTDNFVVGVEGQISALAAHLLKRMRHRRDLVTKYDLPSDVLEFTDWWIDEVLRTAIWELVVDELIAMRDEAEIHWINGHWQMIQSLIDEYRHTRETVAAPHQLRLEAIRAEQRVKFDRRNQHGWVRDRRQHAGIAPTSIGGAPQYA